MGELNERKLALAFVRLAKANPLLEIVCSDINELIRSVRDLTGYQVIAKNVVDEYYVDEIDKYGRTWNNLKKRINKRSFTITVEYIFD